MIQTNKIKAGTIVRTVVLILALINQILLNTGHDVLPISDDDINTIVTTLLTVGAALVAWWKNNSFTKSAIKADEFKETLKENENNL